MLELSACFVVAQRTHSGSKSCLPFHLPPFKYSIPRRRLFSVVAETPGAASTPFLNRIQPIFSGSMPTASKIRSVRYSFTVLPVTFWAMLPSMQEPAVLYMKTLPGSLSTSQIR